MNPEDDPSMAVIDAIMTRRSVRKYSERQIPDSVLEKIVQAGIHAPSALNMQPWGFIIVQDQAFLDRISNYCLPIMRMAMEGSSGGISEEFRALLATDGYSIYYRAPTVIMIIGKTASRFREIDCSLCAENMMLAAHALGVGSCWIGSTEVAYGNEELMAGFGIPESYSPVGTIVFGYPSERTEAHEKREPFVKWIR